MEAPITEPDRTRIEALARHLLWEGYVDNEADARLAAIRIILVKDRLPVGPEDVVPERPTASVRQL